jgi:hypothetical protein
MRNDPIHILSLGAGVQSSTLALMAARGDLAGYGPPHCAIFADTGDEPAEVYSWLEWLKAEIHRQPYRFPIYTVAAKNALSATALTPRVTKDGRAYYVSAIPTYSLHPDGTIGKVRQRTCTRDFKLRPLFRLAKKIAAVPRKKASTVGIYVKQWVGISRDEIVRMKPSREWWAETCWPLIDVNMTRNDCLRWMADRGYPTPPRSACVFCPFHSDAEWRRIKETDPESWAKAVKFDHDFRDAKKSTSSQKTVQFLHRTCKPLDQIDFTPSTSPQLELWANECSGMCGN